MCDFVKPKKVFTPMCSDKMESDTMEKSKKIQQSRFDILGCLLQDVEVSEEEQQDGSALGIPSDTMPWPTPSPMSNKRESKLQSWNFAHICTAAEKCKASRRTRGASFDPAGNGIMRKIAAKRDVDEWI